MVTIKIVTPDGVVYQDENINMISLPTTTGVISVKADHIPLVSVVAPGEIIIKKENHEVHLAVSRGVVEIRRGSEVHILADTAERAEDIDEERALEAKARAEEYLKQKQNIADIEFAKIQASIEKELARVRVARKYKNVGGN